MEYTYVETGLQATQLNNNQDVKILSTANKLKK
jgi:hypothetical protein